MADARKAMEETRMMALGPEFPLRAGMTSRAAEEEGQSGTTT
jgi:hypothetical protein